MGDRIKSKYKGVWITIANGNENQVWYQASKMHKHVCKQKIFATEREAAISYDLMCIEFGLNPVNILKPK